MKLLTEIDNIVATGKLVASADDQAIIDIVKAAIRGSASISFYLTRTQADAIKDWLWTPERTRRAGLRLISEEETQRIRAELGVEVANFRFSPIECDCGHTYGAFDFIQQGIREHGLDAVTSVFSLKNSTLLQVNPRFVPICPVDNQDLLGKTDGGITYESPDYGGCSCCAKALFNES
ncbi:hypothetical protein [Kitasatospora brasiliensis]|uniref:hypothetical protein n=1 Tax=Kitasatospora brasiliensis TaxID=3058040 RepID=UPI002931A9EB|nr:hypothetical protein [Kitasatospora sp. K002]